MTKLNPDLLVDSVYELVEEIQKNPGCEEDSSLALDKFYLSGRESVWAFEGVSASGTSGILKSYYDTKRFSLTVEYKRDHTCSLPYIPGTNSCNKLFLAALYTVKSLKLGDLEPLPDEIEGAITSNPYLEEINMHRVLQNESKLKDFSCITKIKNLKKLTCSILALQWFRENRIILKLKCLSILQARAVTIFEFLANPCFETEELEVSTLNLTPKPVLDLVQQRVQLPFVKKFYYIASEHEVHGRLPEVLPILIRAFTTIFPELEHLELIISTEPLFITKADGQFSPSVPQLIDNYNAVKEAIKNIGIPEHLKIVFKNPVMLWFKIPTSDLSPFFDELKRTFPEHFTDRGAFWRISDKTDNIETQMIVSTKRKMGFKSPPIH